MKDLIEDADANQRKAHLAKYTKPGSREFQETPELEAVARPRAAAVKTALGGRYEVIDVAEKLNSGGSSFGLPRYWALVKNPEAGKEPLIIELKSILPPSLAPGKRADGGAILDAQKALGGLVSPHTGAAKLEGRAFLIREHEPEKGSLKLEKLDAEELDDVVAQSAKVLARAHAQKPSDAKKLAQWAGDDAGRATARLVDFSKAYADQATGDHAAFRRSVAK